MDKWLYLIIDVGAISIPLIASFDRRLRFDKLWRYLFPAIFLTMAVFIPWDMVKTHFGVWGFNPRYLSGFYIGNLPVEEWLFFIAIPYACMFTYHALNYMIKRDYFSQIAHFISIILAIFFLVVGFYYIKRIYTSVTFISTGSFLLFNRYLLKAEYLGRFFIMYIVILIPFFVLNGLLTGAFISEEVVYYNNVQNLGIRIGTIPVEDLVYGMLLLLMNVTWFEWLQKD